MTASTQRKTTPVTLKTRNAAGISKGDRNRLVALSRGDRDIQKFFSLIFGR